MSNGKNMQAKQHGIQMLSWAFENEKKSWKSCGFVKNTSVLNGAEVSGEQRDVAVEWLLKVNCALDFSPETIFLASAIIDKFLHTVKAHPKYLKCIAVTCFYIASKLIEESEVIPTISRLLDVCGSSCTASEISRMERLILNKMNWNLKIVTVLDFLHMFHRLITLFFPGFHGGNDIEYVNQFWMKNKSILLCHKLACFPPSTVALAIISIDLELGCKRWTPLAIHLKHLAQKNYSHFRVCRNEVLHIMSETPGLNHRFSLLLKPPLFFPAWKEGALLQNPVRLILSAWGVDD